MAADAWNDVRTVTLKRSYGKSKGVSESEPNTESAEPNGGELANIVSKIPGSSRCEDVNEW